MSEETDLRKALLRKLFLHRYIGHKHTAFDNLPKGFHSYMHKEVRRVAEGLMREGLLIRKPTTAGLHVALNPKRLAEIRAIIE